MTVAIFNKDLVECANAFRPIRTKAEEAAKGRLADPGNTTECAIERAIGR